MSVHQKYWFGANLQSRRCQMERRLELVEQNDVAQLAEHLNNQGPVRPKELNLALQTAILKKSDEYCQCVQLLLSHGANPDGRNGNGVPFLVIAAEAGCYEIVAALLAAKCDPNICREDGSTALHRATWLDQCECVQILLDAGADTDIQDNQGRTPFLLATQGDRIEVMEQLLKIGCDPAILDKKGRSSLYWAARYDNTEVMQFLLEEDEDMREVIDTQDQHGYTALMVAAERGHVESVKLLLEYGANADLENTTGASALLLAARGHHIDCSCALLEEDIDVNITDETGASPLIYLIQDDVTVSKLLQSGADPNVITRQGWTPLTVAASLEAHESLRILLRANVCYNGNDNKGPQRPIREAVVNGRLENVKLLLHAAVLLGLDIHWVQEYLQEAYLLYLKQQNSQIMAIYTWLEEEIEKGFLVPHLAQLCRRCIRESIDGASFHEKIESLPLPPALKLYLLLPEIDTLDLSL